MTRSNHYNTKQKDLILDCIKNHNEFTVNDIYEELNKEVGLTTIYRKVDELVNENKIKKYIGKDNVTYYQYLCDCDKDNHFYLKCEKCGTLEHVDCDCINELSEHINKNHEFEINKQNIVINGVCKNCK
jgi:Fur family ferric uptake transcriptional regulator